MAQPEEPEESTSEWALTQEDSDLITRTAVEYYRAGLLDLPTLDMDMVSSMLPVPQGVDSTAAAEQEELEQALHLALELMPDPVEETDVLGTEDNPLPSTSQALLSYPLLTSSVTCKQLTMPLLNPTWRRRGEKRNVNNQLQEMCPIS
jgi:hypothetical protein